MKKIVLLLVLSLSLSFLSTISAFAAYEHHVDFEYREFKGFGYWFCRTDSLIINVVDAETGEPVDARFRGQWGFQRPNSPWYDIPMVNGLSYARIGSLMTNDYWVLELSHPEYETITANIEFGSGLGGSVCLAHNVPMHRK